MPGQINTAIPSFDMNNIIPNVSKARSSANLEKLVSVSNQYNLSSQVNSCSSQNIPRLKSATLPKIVKPYRVKNQCIQNPALDLSLGNEDEKGLQRGLSFSAESNKSQKANQFGGNISSDKVSFRKMDLAQLIDSKSQYTNPPTSKDFKVIEFNEALKLHNFKFESGLIEDIRRGLLAGKGPSYKYLSSMAIGISNFKEAIDKHHINDVSLNRANIKLDKLIDDLSKLGNDYKKSLDQEPGADIDNAFLCVKRHKKGNFSKLFKRAAYLSKELKYLVRDNSEIKKFIENNKISNTKSFICHYFNLSVEESNKPFPELIKSYVKPNALEKISALLKDNCREREGHQFDCSGFEHVDDSYAEIFDYFKTNNEVNNENLNKKPKMVDTDTDTDRTDSRTPILPDQDVTREPIFTKDIYPGIHNHFNPVNSPVFNNNFHSSDLLDGINKLRDSIDILNKRHFGRPLDKISQDASSQTETNKKFDMSTQADINDTLFDEEETKILSNHNDETIADNSITEQLASGIGENERDANLYTVDSESETETIHLQPTVRNTQEANLDNTRRGEQDYYDPQGRVAPGVVRAQQGSFESVDTLTRQLSPERSATTDLHDHMASAETTADHLIAGQLARGIGENERDANLHAVGSESEPETIRLQPTVRNTQAVYPVNARRVEQDYYDPQGRVIPGVVRARQGSFESVDTLTRQLSPERSVTTDLRDHIASAETTADHLIAGQLARGIGENKRDANLYTVNSESEPETIRLQPTVRNTQAVYPVNARRVEQDYYDPQGRVIPGVVRARQGSFESVDTLTRQLSPERSVTTDLHDHMASASAEATADHLIAGQLVRGIGENKRDANLYTVNSESEPETIRLQPTVRNTQAVYPVNARRVEQDYYDPQGRVVPGVVRARQGSFESVDTLTRQLSPERSVTTDLRDHIASAETTADHFIAGQLARGIGENERDANLHAVDSESEPETIRLQPTVRNTQAVYPVNARRVEQDYYDPQSRVVPGVVRARQGSFESVDTLTRQLSPERSVTTDLGDHMASTSAEATADHSITGQLARGISENDQDANLYTAYRKQVLKAELVKKSHDIKASSYPQQGIRTIIGKKDDLQQNRIKSQSLESDFNIPEDLTFYKKQILKAELVKKSHDIKASSHPQQGIRTIIGKKDDLQQNRIKSQSLENDFNIPEDLTFYKKQILKAELVKKSHDIKASLLPQQGMHTIIGKKDDLQHNRIQNQLVENDFNISKDLTPYKKQVSKAELIYQIKK